MHVQQGAVIGVGRLMSGSQGYDKTINLWHSQNAVISTQGFKQEWTVRVNMLCTGRNQRMT